MLIDSLRQEFANENCSWNNAVLSDPGVIDVLIVADDLTGACDAAVAFAASGFKTVVPISGLAPTCDVLAVNTETRDLEPSAIPGAIARVAHSAPPARTVFKKIDSTLRGHAAVEIQAALDDFHCDAAIVCPAFPANHRLVREGYLFVANAPDFEPVHIASRLSCRHVDLPGLEDALAGGARIVSLDAVSESDLEAIAAAIHSLRIKILWAGSAGLSRAFVSATGARCGAPCKARAVTYTHAPQRRPTRPLFLLGSDHPVTLGQQEHLRTRRPDAHVIRLPYNQVPPGKIERLIADAHPEALVLSGGATASLVCRAIGAESIEIHQELIPGVPLGTIRGGACDGTPVVTKSGGFGPCDTLVRIADYFYAPESK